MRAVRPDKALHRPARVLVAGRVEGPFDALGTSGIHLERVDHAIQALDPDVRGYDLVFIDGEGTGIGIAELVTEVRQRLPSTLVVVVFDAGVKPSTVDAFRAGASDCLFMPIHEDDLVGCLRRNLGDDAGPIRPLNHPAPDLDLDGGSVKIVSARRALVRAAESDLSALLITGQPGAGKTRAANFVHAHRPLGPLLRLLCSTANPQNLQRSLFGDAPPDRPSPQSLWARARGSYLCLEEVPRLPVHLQQILEQLLEAQELDATPTHRRVRVIGTSSEGGFDVSVTPPALDLRLMHRLWSSHIHIPSLDERSEDIRAIGRSILDRLAIRFQRPGLTADDEAWRQLESSRWPDNVRQLQGKLQRATLAIEGNVLTVDALEPWSPAKPNRPSIELPVGGLRLEDVERDLVAQALRRAGGNRTRAGQLLGLNRDQVRYRIDKFGLE